MSVDLNRQQRRQHAVLRSIAVFKFVKAALMLLVALAALALVSHDLAQWARDAAGALQVRTHSHYVQLLLAKLCALQPHSLEAVSAVAFGYAALLLTEGVGLWLEKRWGEYLTIVITASLVPVELYELWLHATVVKLAALCVNLAVVGYLVVVLRRERRL
ncbi:MAG: DUF2127 domain-containing protein [Verrucomicrobia bacterium]|nr:DUF2127 domain-containing protein [Verrucomicrobiota bacterium]